MGGSSRVEEGWERGRGSEGAVKRRGESKGRERGKAGDVWGRIRRESRAAGGKNKVSSVRRKRARGEGKRDDQSVSTSGGQTKPDGVDVCPGG